MMRFADVQDVSMLLRFVAENQNEILQYPTAPSIEPGIASLRRSLRPMEGGNGDWQLAYRLVRQFGRAAFTHPAVVYLERPNPVVLAPWAFDLDALDAVETAGLTGDFARAASRVSATSDSPVAGMLDLWNSGVSVEYVNAAFASGAVTVPEVLDLWETIPLEYLSEMGGAA